MEIQQQLIQSQQKVIITPLRISTMTVTGHLGTKINIPKLWDAIPIMPYWNLAEGLLKMEHNMNKKGLSRTDILLKRKKQKKKFFNQATVIVRIELTSKTWKEVNVKLFSNGGTQMTGILSEDMGKKAINMLLQTVKNAIDPAVFKEIFAEEPSLIRYATQLVNSDYSIGVAIRRDRLHRILVQNYRLFSTFESDIYQGVNTKYFVNKERPEGTMPGLCGCPSLCTGSGTGLTIGSCKSVTIAPFQTGKLIITGARTLEQIVEAYNYVNMIITTHAEEIIRPLPPARTMPLIVPTALQTERQTSKKSSNEAKWVQHPSPRQCHEFLVSQLISA
jgi:TATA-box binding protein (TBP) (component of TFIID and TFIIIB)